MLHRRVTPHDTIRTSKMEQRKITSCHMSLPSESYPFTERPSFASNSLCCAVLIKSCYLSQIILQDVDKVKCSPGSWKRKMM